MTLDGPMIMEIELAIVIVQLFALVVAVERLDRK